jgi:hypothetical protein
MHVVFDGNTLHEHTNFTFFENISLFSAIHTTYGVACMFSLSGLSYEYA